jgi:hypothetical protein
MPRPLIAADGSFVANLSRNARKPLSARVRADLMAIFS